MQLNSKTMTAALGAFAVAGALLASGATAEAKFNGPKNLGWKAPFPKPYPHPKPFPHKPHKHGWGWGGAGIGLGLAAGALIANQAYAPAADCYVVRKRVWSDYYGAVVVRRVTVCE